MPDWNREVAYILNMIMSKMDKMTELLQQILMEQELTRQNSEPAANHEPVNQERW